jgi:hypothetical protein
LDPILMLFLKWSTNLEKKKKAQSLINFLHRSLLPA